MRGDSLQKSQHGRSHHWVGPKTAGSVLLATGIPTYSPHPGNWLKPSQVPSEPVCRPEKDGKVGRLGEEQSARNENGPELPRRTTDFVLSTLLTHSGTPTDKGLHEIIRFRGQCAAGRIWLLVGRAWVQMLDPYEPVKRDRSGQVASCLWATVSSGVEKRTLKLILRVSCGDQRIIVSFFLSLPSLLLCFSLPPFLSSFYTTRC